MSLKSAAYIAGGLLAVAWAVVHANAQHHPLPAKYVSVTAINGTKLRSLFDGAPTNPKLLRLQAQMDQRRLHPACGKEPSPVARALSLLGIVPAVVHAQGSCDWSCGEQAGCGGNPVHERCSGNNCGGSFTFGYVHTGNTADGDQGDGNFCQGAGCNACYSSFCTPCPH